MDSTRHTCLKLHPQQGETIFAKGTWFDARFDLSITDGLHAWICHGTSISQSNFFLKKSIQISPKSWILFFFCEFSVGRGGERARGPVGPAGAGVRGAGRAVLRVSATRFGLPVRRCRRRPQKGLCLLLTFKKFSTFFSSVWLLRKLRKMFVVNNGCKRIDES